MTPAPPSARSGPAVRWRVPAPVRRSILLAHIAFAGTWLGLDVALGVLVLDAARCTSPGTNTSLLAAAAEVGTWPLIACSLLTLLTGTTLGLCTPYGLVRHWWVLLKLVLNLTLAALVVALLVPLLDHARAAAETAIIGGRCQPVGVLVDPPVVSTTALLAAMGLAVFKPGGRVRRGTRGPQ